MDDGAAEALRLRLAAVARKWLEDPRADYAGNITHAASQKGHALNSLVLAGARISISEHGRVVCSFQVPRPLTDSDGTWHAGAVAAAVDNMCSAVVFTVVGAPTATVHYGLSYFSPVACNEEVQLDGRVVGRKGKLTAAVVEVRKMGSGELVAIGRQWMTPAWPTKSNKSVETDPRNPQILGGPVPHEWQDKIGGIPECSHNLLPTTAADLEWLTMKKIAKDGVAEHWSKLKISEDDATTAPSFKFRRSCEMVVI